MQPSVLVVLVALVGSCHAGTYYWNGANTDFANSANWQAGQAPSPTTCKVDFGSVNRTIVSKIDAGTYNVGSQFSLGMNSQLLLPSGGLVISFSDAAVTESCTSTWIGGNTNVQSNDFTCHANYLKSQSGTLSRTNTSLCQTDQLIFNATHTVKVWFGSSMPVLPLNRIQANGVVLTAQANWAQLGEQFSLIDPNRIRLSANTEDCVYQKDGECVCFSSCPTPQMYADEVAFLTGQQQVDANAAAAALAQVNIVTATGTFAPSSLGSIAATLSQIVGSADLVNTVMTTAAASFARYYPGSLLSGGIQFNSGQLVFNGQINTTVGAINIMSVDASVGGSLLQLAIKQALTDGISQATNQITVATLPTNIQTVLNGLANYTNNPGSVIANITQMLNAVGGACSALCVSNIVTQLQTIGAIPPGADPTTINNLVSTVATSLCSPTTSSSCTQLQDSANTIQSNNAAAAAANPSGTAGSTPFVELLSSPVYTQATKVRDMDPDNAVRFKNSFFTSDGLFKVLPTNFRITSMDLMLKPPTLSARRRRSAANEYTLWAQFNYTAFCTPSTPACDLTSTASMAAYNQLLSGVNTLAASYQPVSSQYFFANNLTYNWPLILTNALSYCQSLSGASNSAEQTKAWVVNITRCGILPKLTNGTCLQADPDAPYTADGRLIPTYAQCNAAITTLAPITTTTTAGPSNRDASTGSGGGGGGSIIPIAAAAGGGAILVIIIVILLMKRRGKRSAAPAKRAADDRTVVAFENPMYDDPTQGGRQPVYDSAIGSGDHEGLYDEPAFAASKNPLKKENPLYSSHENLDGGAIYDNDTGGGAGNYQDVNPGDQYLQTGAANPGYLDTAPADPAYLDTHPNPEKGGGYLDVAPETEVADTGYLDQ